MEPSFYGFVYIWYDAKRHMFYVGSHKGRTTDTYVCSSQRMKSAHKKRPHDFKRRILSLVVTPHTGREAQRALLAEEQRWLNFIKPEELGIKYYNLKAVAAGGRKPGVPCSDLCKQRSSEANKGRVMSPEFKQRARELATGKKYPNRKPHAPEKYIKSSLSKIRRIRPDFDPDKKYLFTHTEYGTHNCTVFELRDMFPSLLTNSLIRLVYGELASTGKWKII